MNEKTAFFQKPENGGLSPDALSGANGQAGHGVASDPLDTQEAMLVLLDLAWAGLSGQKAVQVQHRAMDRPLLLLSAQDVVTQIQKLMQHDAVPRAALRFDEAAWRAEIDGQDLRLTAIEFQLLRVLAHAPQRLFTRSQLISGLYHDGRVVSERTIDSHIRKIRRKVEAVSPALDLIETMYGVGYRFIGKVIRD